MTLAITRVAAPPEVIAIAASRVKPRALDPIWPGVLWAGKPTLLAGDPGLGKSMVTCDIAARVSTGSPWPCTTSRREPADVVMLSAEDDPEDTLVPRLQAAGADLNRITFIAGIREFHDDDPAGHRRWLSLDEHLDALGNELTLKMPRLVIIDPLASYLGRGTDSHNEGDVRTVLAGLADLAARHRCAILAIRHLRKADSASAQHRLIGSVAFAAAARAVYVVVRDPNDENRRLMLCAKNNLAEDATGFSYVIETAETDVGEQPRVAWAADPELRSADEVLGQTVDQDFPIDGAEQWLRQVLADGPLASAQLFKLAERAGHKRRTIERARQRMEDVKIERDVIAGQGARGPWQWRLTTPPGGRPPPPHLNNGGVAGHGSGYGLGGRSAAQSATPPQASRDDAIEL